MYSPRSTKGRIGVVAIFLIPLIPAVLWLLAVPPSFRFSLSFALFDTFGQFAGVIGLTLFALTLIMSARLVFLENYFGGLDRLYNIHHSTGVIAFLLLAIHPLLLSVRYMVHVSFADAANFLMPSANWPKNFGIISLLIMMALLSITFYAKWRYQLLRFLHQILGVAFFFGALHGVLIPSDVSSNALLKWFMLSLSGIALAAYTYRTIFGSMLVKRYSYIVHDVRQLDATVTEIVMVPESDRMHYLPGQFLFVSFQDAGVDREVHPFSISSAPFEKELRITAKALGDYTRTLKDVQIGSVARIEGPFGRFSYLRGLSKSQIWIAGGIGITPFLNMARNLRINNRADYRIDFYYSTKTASEMIFLSELKEIALQYPKLRIIPFSSDEKGFLTMDVVHILSGELRGRDIYVCGPPPMMHGIVAGCKKYDIPKKYVHCEEFKLL